MKTGSHWEELNESNVLKSMLDKIMNTTTGKQKKKVSAHKTGAYSRKKLYWVLIADYVYAPNSTNSPIGWFSEQDYCR
jgi:hypothetical protein